MHLLRWKKDPRFDSLMKALGFARQHLDRKHESATIARITGIFRQWVTNEAGLIVAGDPALELLNTLTNEGANWIRDIMFKGGSAPAASALYIGLLLDSATPSVSLTLASGPTGEATGNGYSRKNVTSANWNSATQGQANNNAAPVTFTASGGNLGGGAVNEAFVCDASSGTTGHLLCYATQSGGPFTVPSGSSLNTTYQWTIS